MIENGLASMEISNIAKIIDFISTDKYFEFNDESYIQTHGTAIGKKMAPTYAHIFIRNFEKYLLDSCTDKPLIYLRYIYDIFYMATR